MTWNRHPEALDALFARRASKGDGPGRSSFEGRASHSELDEVKVGARPPQDDGVEAMRVRHLP
jgi:hypothetical protein